MKAKKGKRVKGPASRLSVAADTRTEIDLERPSTRKKAPAAIRSREQQIMHDKKVAARITQDQMMADTFNVIHARICLNDGLSTSGDVTEVREKLFEIISVRGWESTLKVLASCARLFAEVPTPVPTFTKYSKDLLHSAAQAMDAKAMELRIVDREATKGSKI